MRNAFFVFILFLTSSPPVFADGFGWHFNTIANYSEFIKFFNDGEAKPFDPSHLDEYNFWYENDKIDDEKSAFNKIVIDHLLSGNVDYSRLSFEQSQALDVFVRHYVVETSSYDSLETERGIDSIRNWCFGEYVDLNPKTSIITNVFASGRRIDAHGPVQCKENTRTLEDAVSTFVDKEKWSKEQLERIGEIDENSKTPHNTCYNSYFALSPVEVSVLVEELKPVIAASEFYEEECPLNGLYEYLQSAHQQKKGLFAWTSD